MADQGHYGGRPGTSRQGIYVCAPNGKFLASINSTEPDRVIAMLRDGLAAWESFLRADPRGLDETSAILPRHRWEESYPEQGLVLHVISRDLPQQCDPSIPCQEKWNQDYLWYSQDEARCWLGSDPQVGQVHSLPAHLVARLARFHFVDNVKGETPKFSPDGVTGSQISTEIVERTGTVVKLKISGSTKGAAPDGWWQSANGVVTRVLGHASFDLAAGRFTAFEIVALGRRWGETRFNGRRRDPDSGPLGYVIRLAAADAPRIAPAHIYAYDAGWVVYPESR